MNLKNFEEVIIDRTGGNKKFKTDEYLAEGALPIIDQGKKFIAGYTNEKEAKAFIKLPCIIFGDHTKIFKYVDFPFALGADGTKALETINGVDAMYLYYYFAQVKLPGKDGYNRKFKYLKEVKIPLPDLKTQQAIAHILEQADRARRQRKTANALTNVFLQSSFLSIFGDPIENEKGWVIGKVGEVFKVETGSTPSRDIKEYYQGLIPWIKTGEVIGEIILESEEKIIERAIKETNCKVFPKNTILVAMYGQGLTRGRVGLLGIPATTNQACAAIIPTPEINPVFMFWFLKNSYGKLRELGRGGNQPNLNLSLVKDFQIYLPPLSLQNQFAAIVAQAEQLRQTQGESQRELEHLFQCLLQKYFG